MKKIFKIIRFLLAIGILYLGFYPISLEPLARESPAHPGMDGAFKVNELLAQTQIIKTTAGLGPEAIVRDSLNKFYSGLENGDIIQFDPNGNNQKVLGNTGGRPLGMKFAPNGWLIIADQKMGLIAMDSLGNFNTLLNEIEGTPIQFADDLVINKEGLIYFSDATQRHPIEIENEFWEQRPSGRIITYDLKTEKSKIILKDLFFPNGIALSEQEDYLIFSETFGIEIKKYWLEGPKKGIVEIFNNELPGYPDNITYSNGTFWVAIPSQRAVTVEPLTTKPFLRAILLRLPNAVVQGAIPEPYAMVLGFDLDGNLKYNLQDPKGNFYYITSVLQVDNKLYLGSLKETGIGIYTLKQELND